MWLPHGLSVRPQCCRSSPPTRALLVTLWLQPLSWILLSPLRVGPWHTVSPYLARGFSITGYFRSGGRKLSEKTHILSQWAISVEHLPCFGSVPEEGRWEWTRWQHCLAVTGHLNWRNHASFSQWSKMLGLPIKTECEGSQMCPPTSTT